MVLSTLAADGSSLVAVQNVRNLVPPLLIGSHLSAMPLGAARSTSIVAMLDGEELTEQLKKASSLPELVIIHATYGENFESVHVGELWGSVKKLARAERTWLRDGGAVKMTPLCEQTARMLPAMEPRHVAKTARALGKLRFSGRQPWELVWNSLPAATLSKLDEMTPKQLCSSAWAFAAAGQVAPGAARHAAPELFEGVAAEAVRRLGEFNGQDVGNLAWALAAANHEEPDLFDAIAAEVASRPLDEFKAQELSITAWAFATAGHAAPAMFEAIAAEAARRELRDFNAQALSNMAWAFAVLDVAPEAPLFESSLFADRCTVMADHFVGPFDAPLSQLHQWSLWREEQGAKWPPLPEALRTRCREAFVARNDRPPPKARPKSGMQGEVSDALRKLGGAKVRDEVICPASGYSIDAVVEIGDGRPVAVEVDGPAHFVGESHQPTGSTVIKRRQLRNFGWRLINVPYWEWTRMQWGTQVMRARKKYLQERLDAADAACDTVMDEVRS